MSAVPLATRDAGPGDMGFVFSTWMNGHVFHFPDRERARVRRMFRATYVDPILAERPRVVVLHSPDTPRALHGHAVLTREGILAWVYVARPLRREGYGRQLVTALLGDYPARIPIHVAWPFPSSRYTFVKFERRHRAA